MQEKADVIYNAPLNENHWFSVVSLTPHGK
jgi:hypothetical protein